MSTFSIVMSVLVGAGGSIAGILAGAEWWQILIILVAYALLQFGVEVVLRILEKKGIISKKDKEEISDTINDKVEDLLDNGKLDNSNKKEEDENQKDDTK